MSSKWDKDLAKDICSWINRATGASVPYDDPSAFAEELKNGQTLCQYVVVFVLQGDFWEWERIVFTTPKRTGSPVTIAIADGIKLERTYTLHDPLIAEGRGGGSGGRRWLQL